MQPTVSVIIPAYQTADLIPETLASVAAQTRTDFEVVIVDDGSTDDILGACAPFLADPRFRIHHFPNGGVTAARNRGLDLAKGQYLAFVDSDDLMEPDYLAVMLAALEANPRAALACCDARMFGVPEREGRLLSEFEPMETPPSLYNVLSGRFLVYTGVTVRADAVRAVDGYSTGMPAAEDFDLWIRLLIAGGEFVFVPRALARYRRRAGSLSNTPIKLHLGRAQAYLRALGALRGEPCVAAICRRKIGETMGWMSLHEAQQVLAEGDAALGRVCLQEADRQNVLSSRWRLLALVLRLWPGLAMRILHRRQNQLTPLARLAAAPPLADTIEPA